MRQLVLVSLLMHQVFLLVLVSLMLASCNSTVELAPQRPKFTPVTPSFKRVGLYLKPQSFPQSLMATIDGDPLKLGDVRIMLDRAVGGSIANALGAVSAEVVILRGHPTIDTLRRHDLDAAFWPEQFAARSQLERGGTLIPSYTSYSNVTLSLARMSAFRGTIDTLSLSGFGSFAQYGTGYSRAATAKLGAEIALRDMATRLTERLSRGQF
jgi:hypothetical protein